MRAAEGRGEPNDIKLAEFGFQQVHANFMPNIQNYARRTARAGVIGGAPSAWAATNEYTFGKDLMMDFLGTSNLMWSTHWPEEEPLSKIVQSLMPEVRRRLSGKGAAERGRRPGGTDRYCQPRCRRFRSRAAGHPGGPLGSGRLRFEVQGPVVVGAQGESKAPLPLRKRSPSRWARMSAASSFCTPRPRRAANDMSYRYIHNFPRHRRSAGLVRSGLRGWLRGYRARCAFGWNILPLAWGEQSDVDRQGQREGAELRVCGGRGNLYGASTLFAYEWVNPRFGKVVKEVRLHGTEGFRDTRTKPRPIMRSCWRVSAS